MKYAKVILLAVAVSALFTAFVKADELKLTRISGTYYGNGGEFSITPDVMNFVGGVPALNDVSLQSFCLEHNENVTGSSGTYQYVINTGAVNGGVGGAVGNFDPLDPLTAWMYNSFVEGTLVGYDYGSGREESARALQNAIWFSEDEIPELTLGAAFYQQALDASPTTIGDIRVLNLYKNGELKQDQICKIATAPEPCSLFLGLLGLCGVILWRVRWNT